MPVLAESSASAHKYDITNYTIINWGRSDLESLVEVLGTELAFGSVCLTIVWVRLQVQGVYAYIIRILLQYMVFLHSVWLL